MGTTTVLVAGATGYIGGRLVPELLEAGHRVRCLARTPEKLRDRPWRSDVEVARGNVLDRDSLDAAFEGVDAAYYLVHSMGADEDFRERDRRGAAAFRDAAAAAGVEQIVYLGGLGDEEDVHLSKHLRSRHEVGRILADGPTPVTELRAAIIIGSGSASFEMLRHLVEVLPAMVTPRWVETRCQPIAIRDVLFYLVRCLEVPETRGRVIQIGGSTVATYHELMQSYAEIAGLRRRLIVPVPVLSPQLSSLWIGLVTPLPTGLARPLVESLVNEVVVTDDTADRLMPRETLSFSRSVELALQRVKDLDVATTWSSADRARDPQAEPHPEDPDWSGGTVFADERAVRADAPPDAVFAEVRRLGGERGWPSGAWLWSLRGFLDKLVGGIGVRRGRRHPEELTVGDPVDFWRVEALEPDRLLRLRAEMTIPGEAWLEFRLAPDGTGTLLRQRARFHPRGLWGRVYWAAMVPFHRFIFPKMVERIAAAAARGRRPVERGAPDGATADGAATVDADGAATVDADGPDAVADGDATGRSRRPPAA